MHSPHLPHKLGFVGKLAKQFIDSKLTPLIIIVALLLGIGATLILPREEEPQITVPMADVFVQMPGASAKEIEQRITFPLEKLIKELPGVEYVYSTSRPGSSLAILVRTQSFIRSVEDAQNLVVSTVNNQPIYLRDVATITDGAEEPANYVFYGQGAAKSKEKETALKGETDAVTIAVAKRPGANAIAVSHSAVPILYYKVWRKHYDRPEPTSPSPVQPLLIETGDRV